MPKREWDEIDEQMEREGNAVRESMRSIAQTRKATIKGKEEKETDVIRNLLRSDRSF